MNIADNIKLTIDLLENTCMPDKGFLLNEHIKSKDFIEVEIDPEQLPDIVSSGNILIYPHKDKRFSKYNNKNYSIQYYKGFQVLVIDVDGVTEDPKTFISHIKYKPTVYCTSYSNKIKDEKHPNGDNEWRFHLYYAFDQMVYGVENFYTVYDTIVADFPKIMKDGKLESSDDKNIRNTKKFLFTSYRYKPENIEYFRCDTTHIIYKVSDFNLECNTEPTYDNECIEKNIISQDKDKETKDIDFKIDPVFYNDLRTMLRKDFIKKYEFIYPYITDTVIPFYMYKDEKGNDKPYVDLRGLELHKVPSSQMLWDHVSKKPVPVIIKNGERHTCIFRDANTFKKVIPNITNEHLVYCVATALYKHYENYSDFKPQEILLIAKNALQKKDFNYDKTKQNKKLKVNQAALIWDKLGITDKRKKVAVSRKMMTDDDIEKYYDDNLTYIEDILNVLHDNGMKTTKKRLTEWLIRNNKPFKVKADETKKLIIQLKEEDPNRSYREISRICTERGLPVTKDTVKKTLS